MTSDCLPAFGVSGNSTGVEGLQVYAADCLDVLPTLATDSVDLVLTSPPYWHKIDYGLGPDQIGLESTPADYVAQQQQIYADLLRVVKPGGAFLLNIGDTYNNESPLITEGGDRRQSTFDRQENRRQLQPDFLEKEPLGIPEQVKQAARSVGWLHRADLIWNKIQTGDLVNSDRPSCVHEPIFYFLKPTSGRRTMANYFDRLAVPSSVLHCRAVSSSGHRCPFPEPLAQQLAEGFCPAGGVVLDPFAGKGGIPKGAIDGGRKVIAIEKNPCHATSLVERCRTTQTALAV